MKEMDKYAFVRAMIIFCFLAFFLGNNLRIYLWIFIFSTFYLIAYRLIRFWTKRLLLYMFEFCYFGNGILIAFLLYYNNSMEIFSITFICNTGLMTSAVIAFNNQTPFNNTDHLTSSWIHTLPLITNWAIRWRHYIYSKDSLKNLNFNFINFQNVKFKYNDTFYGLIYYPIIFWCFWAIFYLIFMGLFLRSFSSNPKYSSGITDFKKYTKNMKIFGDTNNLTIFKYLLQHFFFLVVMFPLSILCFYNYYVNTFCVIFIIFFLAWNTARNNIKYMKKQENKKGNLLANEC